MYYPYTHPDKVSLIPQSEYVKLFTRVLDSLCINEDTIEEYKYKDEEERRSQIEAEVELIAVEHDDIKKSLAFAIFNNISSSLEGRNQFDDKKDHKPIRVSTGTISSIFENHPEFKDTEYVCLVGTINREDLIFVKDNFTKMTDLDLTDALICEESENFEQKVPDAIFKDYKGAMKEILLHDEINTIGKGAFSGCSSLNRISFPIGLTNIEDQAFEGCTSLESIAIKENLQKIGYHAFNGCTNLNTVFCMSFTPPKLTEGDTQCFDKVYQARIVIPKDTTENYKNSDWAQYFEHILEHSPGNGDFYRAFSNLDKIYIGYTEDEKMAIVKMLNVMSQADNNSHICEQQLEEHTALEEFGFNEEQYKKALSMDLCLAAKQVLGFNDKKKENFLKLMEAMAYADGGKSDGEKEMFKILHKYL